MREDTAERVRGNLRLPAEPLRRVARRRRTTAQIEARSLDFQRLRRELLDAERAAVTSCAARARSSDEVARRVERDLDLEDARLEI